MIRQKFASLLFVLFVGVPFLLTAGACGRTSFSNQCVSDEDCDPGSQCIGNFCSPPGSTTCSSDTECADGSTCEDGFCKITPQCATDQECGEGEICRDGSCISECICASDMDCPVGQTCSACQCEDLGCQTDNDCRVSGIPGAAICLNGDCVPVECQNDNQCPNGEFCISNRCTRR